MQDTTSRQDVKETLPPLDGRLHAVLDATPTGIAIVEADGRLVWRNSAYRDLLGYSDEQLEALRLEDLAVPADRARLETLRARMAAGEAEVRSGRSVGFVRRDGNRVQLTVSITRATTDGVPLSVVNLHDVSEQVIAEQQLAEEEARFQHVFDSASGGLLIIGTDGLPERGNPALLRIFGTSFAELERRRPEGFIASDQQQLDLTSCITRQLDGGEGSCAQTLQIQRDDDGELRTVEVNCQPLLVGGEIRGVLAEFTDVTELRAAERALMEREAFLSTTLEAVRSGVMVLNLEGSVTTVNRNAYELVGYSAEELQAAQLSDVFDGEDLALMQARFAARARGEEGPDRTLVRARRKDGVRIDLDVRGAPLVQAGELRGVVVDFRDVTTELAMQRRLEDTAERLRILFETVGSGLLVIGPDMALVTCNEALASIVGCSVDEVLSQSMDAFLVPEERELAQEALAARLRGESVPDRIPSKLVRSDGNAIDIDIRHQPFVIGGETIGLLCEIRDVTEELELQRQVQETAERLEAVFASVSTGLALIGSDRQLVTVNQALSEITGYRRDELLVGEFEQWLHPAERESLVTRFGQRLSGERSTREEIRTRMIRKDGEVREIAVNSEPFLVDGAFAGVLSEIRDVTEEVSLQRRLQETADRLNTVFETVSTGLALWGPDRMPQTMNQAFSEITGYSQEELQDKQFDHLLHPDDLELTRARFQRRIAGEEVEPHWINVRAIRKDGEEMIVELRAEPFTVDGEIKGVLTEIRDVTAELELQSLVTESADQISTILEATPDAIVVADDQQVILRVNAATEIVFGMAPDDLVGQPVSILVGGGDRKAHASYVDHYRRTGEASTLKGLVIGDFREAVGRRFDGSEFPAELAVAETALHDGRRLFVAAIRDITERKRAEEELGRLNEELEDRSGERQALVQQLLSAQEEERRTVAYDIHDGPAQQLAAAQMFLEAYVFDQKIDVQDGDSSHLLRAMSYLTSGLTDTRRIMSGLRPALLDDVGLADALHELLREMTERAEIEFELRTSELIDELSPGIEITLYRVAQEAVGNALKHSGGDRISVNLRSDGSEACLQVTDNGNGFDPLEVDGPQGGHHYGLVGMRERVELLDGHFHLEASAGLGTVVTATIPLREASTSSDPDTAIVSI